MWAVLLRPECAPGIKSLKKDAINLHHGQQLLLDQESQSDLTSAPPSGIFSRNTSNSQTYKCKSQGYITLINNTYGACFTKMICEHWSHWSQIAAASHFTNEYRSEIANNTCVRSSELWHACACCVRTRCWNYFIMLQIAASVCFLTQTEKMNADMTFNGMDLEMTVSVWKHFKFKKIN